MGVSVNVVDVLRTIYFCFLWIKKIWVKQRHMLDAKSLGAFPHHLWINPMLSVLSSRKVPSPWGLVYKSLSLPLHHKVLENCQILQMSVIYDHVKSIYSVTATMYEVTAKNGLLTDISYCVTYLVSKPFFTVTLFFDSHQGKSLSSRTNLHVLVLGLQVKILELFQYFEHWILFRSM